MKHWNINYFFNSNGNSPVKEWIDELSDESKAEIFKVFELLKKYDIELGLPLSSILNPKSMKSEQKTNPAFIGFCILRIRIELL